jgi:hypothetical protein
MQQFLLFLATGLLLVNTERSSAADALSTNAGSLNGRPITDAQGRSLRRAPTGHISNYDESKAGGYTLPDPLMLLNGRPVRDAGTWIRLRRPEILKLYETEVFGRVPDSAPKMRFEVSRVVTNALAGRAIRKNITARIGSQPDAPEVKLVLYLPAKVAAPVPVLLQMLFRDPPEQPTWNDETGPVTNLLAHGYAYAAFRYTQIEGDSRSNNVSLVRRLALAQGQAQPGPGEWGTITAWAWGASQMLNYLETDPAVDAKRVGLIGHSRLGKTALWAGARDPRFALVFASCSGEMGASLSRRDFGESLDDVIASFPRWFVAGFEKYSARWNDVPVDSHMIIALQAPRPVFITGGTEDLWADPRGQFLAEVAAGPVYRLLGKGDLGTTEMPTDTPLIQGSLGFHLHTGGHGISAADWEAFVAFADRHWLDWR